MMKHFLLLILSVLLCASMALAQPAAKPATDVTKQLLSAAQAAARDNKADIATVAAAYEQVFQAADLSSDQRLQAHLDLARYFASKGQLTMATAEYDRSLAAADLTPAQKCKALTAKAKTLFDSNFQGAFASYFTQGLDQAAAVYQQIIAMPDSPSSEKIAAYQGLANCYLEKMDETAANQALDMAIQLPALTEAELATAKKNKADALYRELKVDAALALYKSIWAETLPNPLRTAIEDRIAAILVEQNRVDEAQQALLGWNRPAMRMAGFYLENGKLSEARKIYEGVLADPKSSFRDRSDAVERLLQARVIEGDAKPFFADAERLIPALIAENEQGWNIYQRLTGAHFTRYNLGKSPAYSQWVAEKIISNPKVSVGDSTKYGETLYNAALQRQDLATAKKLAEQILAKDVNATLKLKYRLSLAVLESNGKADGILNKVEAVLKEMGVAADDPKARADALLTAARAAMSARYEAVAKALYAAREKMRVPQEPRTLACTFLANGPKDITAFLLSDYVKDAKNRGRLDRKYGDNVKFLLETDSALTGRVVTEQQANFTPTEFVATCDEEGVKIFFMAPTDKAKAIADGLAKLGGYEMYLAAGVNEPYHCYLVDSVPGSMGDNFVTQYNNAHFRRARQAENTAKIEHRILNNGVASLLSISWEAFFDKLPKTGDVWNFDAIHWEQGGYSWGGSESVHNRSSYGSLVFANMTPDNLRAIKRRMIAAAADEYRSQLSAKNGYVEIWQDPELGDQQFFFEVVKPLQDKLDAYLKKVGPGMSAEDTDLLYAEAVPQWMNIKYIVANLRHDYLAARRTENR